MADERKRRRWPWVVLAVLVLYPLSVGPAMRLWVFSLGSEHSDTVVRGIEVFYAPVEFIANRAGLQKPFHAYLEWWYADAMNAWITKEMDKQMDKPVHELEVVE